MVQEDKQRVEEEEESRANRKAPEEEEDVPDVINNFFNIISFII